MRATVNRPQQVRASLSRPAVVAIWVLIAYGLLVVGAVLLLAVIVGACAAVVVLLYGVAHLCVYLLGFSFRWGLVTACGVLFLGCAVGGLIHDLRLEVMPPEPAERQTADGPAS
jgi:Ni/Fe-hydrogenase subunit HybB-like protein